MDHEPARPSGRQPYNWVVALRPVSQLLASKTISEALMTVGQIILQQLGGSKFIAMTGARAFIGLEDGLSFKLPSDSNFVREGINYIRIKLNVRDTYDIEFGKVRGLKYKQHSTHEDIYNDSLRDVISRVTGLALSLGTMNRQTARRSAAVGELVQ
jgi:hypothetical protein